MSSLARIVRGIAVGSLVATAGCIVVDRAPAHVSYYPEYGKVSPEEAQLVPEISGTELLPTVRDRYAAAFAQLEPGMTVPQFRALFGDAAFMEQRKLNAGAVGDAYSVQIKEKLRYKGERYVFTHKDEEWFYFVDGKLVKWGDPDKWP